MLDLKPGLAKIRIKNLRLRTYIGINDDEIRNKQDVLINITLVYRAKDAVISNNIEDALNYRSICKTVIALVESKSFALLERLTQEVLDCVMNFERVEFAEVEIDKPHALRFSESVSITLTAQRHA
ncbi:dihydroneopterin triphosphate 2'-epimerase [Thiopseudomonas acetoxidans]|uniref:Dihydroneopterin triphosphate 2'-epimerase n=1 Tax=Thiopseudomonas acetoxidans TaxID=3041622 RepID=A0ABT7SLJ6_9GAMM|nr:dihydroneopterin triphosphate 2'-epimerase [Thiopseudomonas sp. CY1220]MDM7857040.1 dihydroneopterin triphosphate 2'-epimerase [Thiopseudomonas sp. CY1220]